MSPQPLKSAMAAARASRLSAPAASACASAIAESTFGTGAPTRTGPAIGVAVAYGRLEIAVILSALNLAVLVLLTPLAKTLEEDPSDEG